VEEPGAGRIDDDKVGGWEALLKSVAQEGGGIGRDDAVFSPAEILAEVSDGGGGGFYRSDFGEMLCERQREKADASVEVLGDTSLLPGGDEVDEWFDEEAVDLEEGAEADSIAAMVGGVSQEVFA
jgi:hypothetical protein